MGNCRRDFQMLYQAPQRKKHIRPNLPYEIDFLINQKIKNYFTEDDLVLNFDFEAAPLKSSKDWSPIPIFRFSSNARQTSVRV
jgi:hypothetical protein